MKPALAAVCILALAACSDPRAPDGRVIVRDQPGGQIVKHERTRERLAGADGVILCGQINSAATIFISLPNACACADARFGFHGARVGHYPSPEGTAAMAGYYPPRLRQWFLRHAAHLILTDYVTLSARDLAAMGALEICE